MKFFLYETVEMEGKGDEELISGGEAGNLVHSTLLL
jgi:hypothetical protein